MLEIFLVLVLSFFVLALQFKNPRQQTVPRLGFIHVIDFAVSWRLRKKEGVGALGNYSGF
jgi:hypothetical protein